MIYIIKRTSTYDETQPCEEAIQRTFEYWHTRTCSEDEFNEKFSQREGAWRSKGKNHTITDQGYITRQENDVMKWSIEINTLDELHSFISKYGQIIIDNSDWSAKAPCIEIYDDYRE